MKPANVRCEYLVNPLGVDAVRPRLSWTLESKRRGARQSTYRVLVASSREKLAVFKGDLWDSGQVFSDRQLQVEYDGKPLGSRRLCFWKVGVWDENGQGPVWSKPAIWSMGLLKKSDWRGSWVADEELGRFPDLARAAPAAMLRREFSVRGAVRRALIYVTARGVYELRLNGRRIGDHLLAPEWTEYDKRIQYQVYDVTGLVKKGANALGAILGEGWYAGRLGLTPPPGRHVYGKYPHLLARLDIELASGRRLFIATDSRWRSTLTGPIRSSDILDGEVYDARREMSGWDRPGFDDIGWKPVSIERLDGVKLVWQCNEPIRVIVELKPVALSEPKRGVYVFDLGQNMVGWCRLKLRGPKGVSVTLRHAEMLNDHGMIYTINLRSAGQTDRYIKKGSGLEVFEPHFTYHGFRYVEVTGLSRRPLKNDLVGRVFCSSAPETGKFQCSNSLVNRLMKNILWGQRGNLHGIPTDCPQRDERCGWTGDILAFCQTAIYNMDMAAFFSKWIRDLRDAQLPDGRFPNFAPRGSWRGGTAGMGVPAWADAGTVVPWRVYQNYADRRVLREHFDSARRWVDYVQRINPGLLWKKGRGHDYSDWLNSDTFKFPGMPRVRGTMDREVFATAFFAHSSELVVKMARVLGRERDADRYDRLTRHIKAAFRRAFVRRDGRIQGGTQAAYAMALGFDILDTRDRPKALRHMMMEIKRYRGHLTTGFHSTRLLMEELTRNDLHSEACRLINLRTPPSWGFMIEQGATTIWERWDGYVKGFGFQDPGMNSFNHYTYGSVEEWIWGNIAGLRLNEERPGYEHFLVRPRPCPQQGFSWARGDYDSICGRITIQWQVGRRRIRMKVTVPPNTSATVYVPTNSPGSVKEGGRSVACSAGVTLLRMGKGAAVFHVLAGDYDFSAHYSFKRLI